MNKSQTLFAFRLAAQTSAESTSQDTNAQDKWQAQNRDAVAGCTDYRWEGNLRYGTRFSADAGIYC
ncbi:MAG: hypothetical protein KA144_10550 [Xanthomonadaceae bacterium]|nr:hypothetical protein [Xanthomonadaceae bacterium]